MDLPSGEQGTLVSVITFSMEPLYAMRAEGAALDLYIVAILTQGLFRRIQWLVQLHGFAAPLTRRRAFVGDQHDA